MRITKKNNTESRKEERQILKVGIYEKRRIKI